MIDELTDLLNDRITLTGKDWAYFERDMLIVLLTKIYPAHLADHPDGDGWEADWKNIVCIHTPAGQLSWHIHKSELPLFAHLSRRENDWDGHSTYEKYCRYFQLLDGL